MYPPHVVDLLTLACSPRWAQVVVTHTWWVGEEKWGHEEGDLLVRFYLPQASVAGLLAAHTVGPRRTRLARLLPDQ